MDTDPDPKIELELAVSAMERKLGNYRRSRERVSCAERVFRPMWSR